MIERERSWEEESAQPLRFITVHTSGHLRGTIISKMKGLITFTKVPIVAIIFYDCYSAAMNHN